MSAENKLDEFSFSCSFHNQPTNGICEKCKAAGRPYIDANYAMMSPDDFAAFPGVLSEILQPSLEVGHLLRAGSMTVEENRWWWRHSFYHRRSAPLIRKKVAEIGLREYIGQSWPVGKPQVVNELISSGFSLCVVGPLADSIFLEINREFLRYHKECEKKAKSEPWVLKP